MIFNFSKYYDGIIFEQIEKIKCYLKIKLYNDNRRRCNSGAKIMGRRRC
jgi:hypothetical protein